MERPISSAMTSPAYWQRFILKLDSRVFALPVNEVDWIQSAANYVRLHAGSNTYLLRETMAHVEAALDPRQFMRVHRNAIVNLSRVQNFRMPTRGSMSCDLQDGSRIPLSRSYQGAVREYLHQQQEQHVTAKAV
ncbi:MAG: LytTR family DNA-binding domain-containing protein [Terriglobales bacterium]